MNAKLKASRPQQDPTYSQEMRKTVVISFVLHFLILVIGTVGLPFFVPEPEIKEMAITVEMVDLAPISQSARVEKPSEPKNEELKPPPAPPKPNYVKPPPPKEPEPEPVKEPEPVVEKQPEPPPEPEPIKEPEPPVQEEPAPEPPPMPVPPPKVKPKPPVEVKKEEPKPKEEKPKEEPKAEKPKDKPNDKPKVDSKVTEKESDSKDKAEASLDSLLNSVLKDEPSNSEPSEEPVKDTAPSSQLSQIADFSTKFTRSEEDDLNRGVQPCWNVNAGGMDAEKQIVSLRVFVNPDRTVRSVDIIDQGRYNSDAAFRTAAEAARRALLNPKCSTLNLPADKYEQWKSFKYNFDPSHML